MRPSLEPEAPMAAVHVAAAVIRRADGAVLLSLRAPGAHQGGLWEFPGGKLEPGERVVDGLARELDEELGIAIARAVPLIRVHHAYPEMAVELDVLEVREWTGEPHGREGQALRWAHPAQLAQLRFPAANVPVTTAARLPGLALIADLAGDAPVHVLLERLEHCLRGGVGLVQLGRLREAAGAPVARAVLGGAADLCRQYAVPCLVAGSPGELALSGAAGLHLAARHLRQLNVRPVGPGTLLSTACRNGAELRHAERLGVDFVYAAPLRTPPARATGGALGWQGLRALAQQARVPVYAAGGAQVDDARRARRAGCQGVALGAGLWCAAQPAAVVRDAAAALDAAAWQVGTRA